MSRIFEVVTPEHVAIRYELAGIGSRGVAVLVDMLLQALLFLPIWYGYQQVQHFFKLNSLELSFLNGFLILFAFIILWAYFVTFETLWNGETPGKRMMGLRVIKDGGYPVDFRSVVIRNLIRALDIIPLSYSVGFVAMLVDRQYRRLGDLAAGTVVVRHGRENEERRLSIGEAVTFRLLDASVLSRIDQLSRTEYRMVQHYLERRQDLPMALHAEFTRRLAMKFIEKFGYQVPALGMDYQRWLEELDLAYRQRALGVPITPLPTTAPPPVEVAPASVDERKW